MKKIVSMLLCLALVLGCAASLAEEAPAKVSLGTIDVNGAFALQCGVPEGYQVTTIDGDGEMIIAQINSEDKAKPVMYLVVAFDETYADVDRMNDLDEEALALLEETYVDMDETVEISYGDTGYGTRLLIAKQTVNEPNYIDFLSVYKGYFVEFVLIPGEESDGRLTDEQMAMSIDFLTELDFIPAEEKPAEAPVAELAGKRFLAVLSGYEPETGLVTVTLKQPVTLSPEEVDGLAVGSTLTVGQETITVETLETVDETTCLVNDEYTLNASADGVHVSFYDHECTMEIGVLKLELPENAAFLDGIDPETGAMLDEDLVRTMAELAEILSGTGDPMDPGLDADNVYVTFDENGGLAQVERVYVPWQ